MMDIEHDNSVTELCCNIDDMTGEAVSFAMDRLFEAGALDVFTTPVGMKKNRPGILLTCVCKKDMRGEILRTLFKHTSTIGVRERGVTRYTLRREEETAMTNYGEVRIKKSRGFGAEKVKPEFEDLKKLALENDVSISDIKLL